MFSMRKTDLGKSPLGEGIGISFVEGEGGGGGFTTMKPDTDLVSCPRKPAGLVNEWEHRQGRSIGGPFQQIQTLLVVNELDIAPVNAFSSILLLHDSCLA